MSWSWWCARCGPHCTETHTHWYIYENGIIILIIHNAVEEVRHATFYACRTQFVKCKHKMRNVYERDFSRRQTKSKHTTLSSRVCVCVFCRCLDICLCGSFNFRTKGIYSYKSRKMERCDDNGGWVSLFARHRAKSVTASIFIKQTTLSHETSSSFCLHKHSYLPSRRYMISWMVFCVYNQIRRRLPHEIMCVCVSFGGRTTR